jgi:transposase
MRSELTDYEWVSIKAFLPIKPRGVTHVNDRRASLTAFFRSCGQVVSQHGAWRISAPDQL